MKRYYYRLTEDEASYWVKLEEFIPYPETLSKLKQYSVDSESIERIAQAVVDLQNS